MLPENAFADQVDGRTMHPVLPGQGGVALAGLKDLNHVRLVERAPSAVSRASGSLVPSPRVAITTRRPFRVGLGPMPVTPCRFGRVLAHGALIAKESRTVNEHVRAVLLVCTPRKVVQANVLGVSVREVTADHTFRARAYEGLKDQRMDGLRLPPRVQHHSGVARTQSGSLQDPRRAPRVGPSVAVAANTAEIADFVLGPTRDRQPTFFHDAKGTGCNPVSSRRKSVPPPDWR